MTTEERIELETVAHRARLSWAFAVLAFLILVAILWVTATPKRWLPLLAVLALAAGGALYVGLRG